MANENTFQRINRTIEERRKDYEPPEKLLNRAYQQNDRQSSSISTDYHETTLELTDKIQESLRIRPTEFDGLQLAGGKIERPEKPLPVDKPPNKYAGLKKCVHPDHEGDRYVHRSQFSADKHHSDGLHSYCKACLKMLMRQRYVPRWKRGV